MLDLLSLITDVEWRDRLKLVVPTETWQDLTHFLSSEISAGKNIFPAQKHWFRAINELPLSQVKVVIIGQDPYHGSGQAHGLSFSVSADTRLPPSLKNIFKEQTSDLEIKNQTGDLTAWVQQGVLLLNTVLTVEEGKAGSHAGRGWESITDAIIQSVNEHQAHVVFLLWGAQAQRKQLLINQHKHCILTAPHPSPLSAHRGWFGCRHFSKANAYLIEKNQTPIDWQVTTNLQKELF